MTTIVAVRRKNEVMVVTDGAVNNEAMMHHVAFGVSKAYQVDNFIIAETGCCLLGFEFKKIVFKNKIMFSQDSLTVENLTLLCDEVKSKIKYQQETVFVIWGKTHGYSIEARPLGKEGSQHYPEAFASVINENYYITGSGQQAANAVYLALTKHKPKMSTEALARECVEIAGNVRMTTHSTPYVLKLC